jgi:hypothetical protein
MQTKFLLGAFLASSVWVFGQDKSIGFTIPESTLSPDKRYGVTVPSTDDAIDLDDFPAGKEPRNKLVESSSGRVIAVIAAETGWSRMNHGGVLPSRWAPDGSLLLWEVDGKWFPDALVLLKIENGALVWQTNILKAAQEVILARTKAAAPQKFAKAKKENAGNGSAYPQGFSVDVEAMDPIALPLRVRVALTSNPKEIPDMVTLESHLEAIVDSRGKFVVTGFHLGRGHSSHF